MVVWGRHKSQIAMERKHFSLARAINRIIKAMSFEKPRPLSPNDSYDKALAEAESYSEMVDDERSGYLSWEERARRARRDQRAHRYFLAHPEIKFRREMKRAQREYSTSLGSGGAFGSASWTLSHPFPPPKAQQSAPIIIVIDDEEERNDQDAVIFVGTRSSSVGDRALDQ